MFKYLLITIFIVGMCGCVKQVDRTSQYVNNTQEVIDSIGVAQIEIIDKQSTSEKYRITTDAQICIETRFNGDVAISCNKK